jgi:hypothetical protein
MWLCILLYSDANAVSDDDDAEYYRQEVGAEPEPELFSRSKQSGRSDRGGHGQRWQKKNFKGNSKGNDGKGKQSDKTSAKGKKRPADSYSRGGYGSIKAFAKVGHQPAVRAIFLCS